MAFFKTEIVISLMEDSQRAFQRYKKESTKTLFNHRAEYEESKLNMAELLDAYNLFEQAVVIDGVDPLTQRIPAEKFLK